MSFSKSHSRFISVVTRNNIDNPTLSQSSYVSPTFKSSLFSPAQDTSSSAGLQDRSFDSRNRRTLSANRDNGVLPLGISFTHRREHVNDPEVYEKLERSLLVGNDSKAEQDKLNQREEKARLNKECRVLQKAAEEKFQKRFEHRMPVKTEVEAAQADQMELSKMVLARANQIQEEKAKFRQELDQQKKSNTALKKKEQEKYESNAHVGLLLSPRKTHNAEEYKRALEKQVKDKQIKKFEEKKVKLEEQNNRLWEIKQQEEAIAEHVKTYLVRKSQSSSTNDSNSTSPTLPVTDKNSQSIQNSPLPIIKEAGAAENGEEVIVKAKETQSAVSLKSPRENNGRVMSPKSTFNKPVSKAKSDWEEACKYVLKRQEIKDKYANELKVQSAKNAKRKEAELKNDREQAMNSTGLNFRGHKPVENLKSVTESLKKQMSEKIVAKKAEAKIKVEERTKLIESQKAEESVAWKEFQGYHQRKANMLEMFKSNMIAASADKKYKGLKTIKI